MSSTGFAKRAMPAERRLWRNNVDWAGWRTFAFSVAALASALLLALYSGVAAEDGHTGIAALCALSALAVAGWVAFTIIPVLARRTPLRWLAYRMDYRVTREGLVYLGGIFIIALAAINTGNNLLFMTLACLLAGILISGVISHAVLSGVELHLDLPEHIFANRPAMALAELVNQKQTLPSFSLRLVGAKTGGRKKKAPGPPRRRKTDVPERSNDILTTPVYFPYLPAHQSVQQAVQLVFPHRGIYRQDSLGLQTRFPFGFLEKTRTVDSPMQAVVYPAVAPSEEFYEILPLVTGELESFSRGRGNDLYSIRDYQTSDSARHVDWKASARTGSLQVREFAREDERRVLLVLDPAIPDGKTRENRQAIFERGVALCASLAWHFHEINSVLAFRCGAFETRMAPAGEIIYEILGHLASAAVAGTESSLLGDLADLPQTFKIILTAQPRGSIPTSLWTTSFIAFLE